MSELKTHPITRPRKTYPLHNTHSSNNAKLDYSSHLALHWIDKWMASQGSLKAPHSGIIRRALALYVMHLEGLAPGETSLAITSVKAACSGAIVSPDDREAAEARLEASGSPLPPFKVVLRGQHQVKADAALMDRMAVLNHIPQKAKPNE